MFYCVLNHEINKTKTVVVAISHMISPLAGMKQNQNQNLEAYTHIDKQRYVENSCYGIISFQLHKHYKDLNGKAIKSDISQYFPFFAKILNISQDGNYR